MADSALTQGQHEGARGDAMMEEEALNAVTIDRELIPLQKAQTLCKTNTFPLVPCVIGLM